MIKGNLTGLRAVEKEDLPILRDWRNNDNFRKHFREIRELSLYNQDKWIEKTNNSPGDFMFVIVNLKTGKPIGAAGLLYTNWIIRSSDFSFYIGEGDKYIDDEGYALDAAKTLIKYGFNVLNLNKIWMELYEFDTMKLDFFLGSLGFEKDGKLRQNCFADGKYWDSYLISLISEDYKKLNW